jgi:hypothetical protein
MPMNHSRGLRLTGFLFLLAGLLPGSLWAMKLSGTAEDLWGNRIDLGKYNQGMAIIHPFSPSN